MLRRSFIWGVAGSAAVVSPSRAQNVACEAAESGDAIVTEQKIARFSPRASITLVRAIRDGWAVAPNYGLISPARIQHFMAQLATETGGFRSIDENLNYTAARLKQVWPRRFKDDSVAEAYAHNPEGLAEFVYGGRSDLGNDQPGDGYRYRGSGFIQLTGRANFREKTKGLGLKPDAEEAPDQVRRPKTGFEVALKFWKSIDGNSLADVDDKLAELRRRVNGGQNGIADTKIWLARARKFFKPGPLSPEESDAADESELSAVQARLEELGVLPPDPEEAGQLSKTVDALQSVRARDLLPRRSTTGLPARLAILSLYDFDVLYSLTDPQLRRSSERGNLT